MNRRLAGQMRRENLYLNRLKSECGHENERKLMNPKGETVYHCPDCHRTKKFRIEVSEVLGGNNGESHQRGET